MGYHHRTGSNDDFIAIVLILRINIEVLTFFSKKLLHFGPQKFSLLDEPSNVKLGVVDARRGDPSIVDAAILYPALFP